MNDYGHESGLPKTTTVKSSKIEGRIKYHLDAFEQVIQTRMKGSIYQFELYDLKTSRAYGYGSLSEKMPWASIYKLFVIAAVLQMIDQGLLAPNEPLRLRPDLYKYGEGILNQFSHLTHLSIVDCCKLVVATSDNVCSDTLHDLAGNERVANLFAAAGCTQSCLTDNIDSLLRRQLVAPHRWESTDYMYSTEMFDNYQAVIEASVPSNCTTATDCNRLWLYLHTSAFGNATRELFFEVARTHNLHSRVGRYANYAATPRLCGKTGSIGAGVVMNESNLLYEPSTGLPLGFFSFFSNYNRQTYYESYDVLACAGLELAKIYTPENK